MLILYRYGETGRSLLPLMQRVANYIRPLINKGQIEDTLRFEMVETLLSASRFGYFIWKKLSIGLALEMIETLGDTNDHDWVYLSR